jgi:hypothetical protein
VKQICIWSTEGIPNKTVKMQLIINQPADGLFFHSWVPPRIKKDNLRGIERRRATLTKQEGTWR